MTKDEERAYKREWYLKNREKCISRARKRHNAQKDTPEYKEKCRAYYLRNQKHLQERSVKHRAENNDIVRANDRKSYQKNKSDRLAKMSQYSSDNPEVNLRASANYRKKHPEKRKLIVIKCESKRRAQKLKTTVGDIDFSLLLKQANGFCAICVLPLDGEWHFDHIIPLSKDGTHTQDNLQVTHPRCNLKKSAKLDYQYV